MMKEFLEAIEKDEELKAKVEELNRKGATSADFSALAKEYGYELTEADFSGVGKDTGELSEDELDAVAGGAVRPSRKPVYYCTSYHNFTGGL